MDRTETVRTHLQDSAAVKHCVGEQCAAAADMIADCLRVGALRRREASSVGWYKR
jgi:hypothetical protein